MDFDIKWLFIGWAAIVAIIMLGSAYEDHQKTIQMSACVTAGGNWVTNKDTHTMECVHIKG